MLRRTLGNYLKAEAMSLRQLSRRVRMPERDLKEALKHLRLSLKHAGQVLDVIPACCGKCHFVFDLDTYHRPSRCPKCKSTWIKDPILKIKPIT